MEQKVIVVALSKKELEVVLHALIPERDRVLRTGGDQYGPMTVGELDNFVSQLQRYQRGD